jgi:hypothetical protein
MVLKYAHCSYERECKASRSKCAGTIVGSKTVALKVRTWDEREFISIDTKTILTEGRSPFDLYFFPDGVDAPILYCQADVELNPAERNRIAQGNIEALYLGSENRDAYRRYVEDNLANMLQSEDMESHEKMGVLYEVAHSLMSDVFDDPRSTESIARSRQLVEHTVGYVIDQGSVLTDFQGIMSLDSLLSNIAFS